MILNGNKRAEVMKNIYKIAVLLSVVTFAVSGCVEENMEPTIPAKDGDEIIFGARAGFENAALETKTVYDVIDKEAKYQKIKWVLNTDKVEVYCPQAINGPTSHYVVVGGAENTEYASLKRTGDSSLQWNGDDTHDFYAMYPSSNMFDANEGFEGVSMTESLITGVVPSEQSPVSVEKDGDNWILNPDMRFAYMAARGSANRYTQTETGNVQNGISLTFMPIVTAVEFQMVLPGNSPELELTEIWLEGSGIAGDFQCDLTDWDGSSCPPCADTKPVNKQDIIQVSTWQTDASGKQVPMTISANATLSFTVFMHPAADISDLKITLYNGAAKVSKTIQKDSAPIIKKQKKTFIKNFALPGKLSEVNEENWMGQIDPETEFNRLSLPGASGAFTQNGGEGYCSQSLSFADLWKAGIRAFEISTDRVKRTDSESDFGDCKVLCNNQPVGDETVETVLSKIDNCLSANGNECAVLILTYQPTGDAYQRDSETYMNEVCQYFTNNYNDRLVKYSPTLKLSEVRGKIIVIVRPTQRDEDDGTERNDALSVVKNSGVNDKILVVDGCGTAKDKWYARGYSYNGKRSPEQGKYQIGLFGGSWESGIEQAIAGRSDSNWDNVNKVPADFSYDVNLSEVENYQVWYQEWARVVPDSDDNGLDDVINRYGSYRWRDSYNEKLADVKTAYDMAMGGNYDGVDENGQPTNSERKYVFINSLSGFYLSKQSGFELSYKPLDPSSILGGFYNGGSKGDIKGLANDLNEDFYQYILGEQKKGKVGATGIVMMDFVSNSLDKEHPGSYYLPSVIIKNNIKYNGQKN